MSARFSSDGRSRSWRRCRGALLAYNEEREKRPNISSRIEGNYEPIPLWVFDIRLFGGVARSWSRRSRARDDGRLRKVPPRAESGPG